MLQEMAAETGAGMWATASLLFFIAVYVFVSVRLYFTPSHRLDEQARMVLDDSEDSRS